MSASSSSGGITRIVSSQGAGSAPLSLVQSSIRSSCTPSAWSALKTLPHVNLLTTRMHAMGERLSMVSQLKHGQDQLHSTV